MGRRFISPEARAELCRLFPHHSDAALAERFGLNVRQVQYIGFREGLRKTPETVRASARRRQDQKAQVPLIERVEKAIAEAGDGGLSRDGIESAISGSSPSSITTSLNKLVAQRRAFRAGRAGRSRWFSTALQAQAHIDAAMAVAKPAKPAPVKVAPSRGPAHERGEPRIPEGLVKQIGAPVPGPEARWHADAPAHFSGRIGRYDEDSTPASWVLAVTNRQPTHGATA